MTKKARNRKRATRRFLPILLAVTAVLLVGIGVLGIFSALSTRYEEIRYPLAFTEEAEEAAARYAIPLPLLYAVIRCESGFRPDVVSHAGAVGLMQVMPSTRDWIASRADAPAGEDLTDPEVNLAYGSYLLAMLYREFGDWRIALAAYNAGINRVRAWVREDPTLQTIPLEETDTYVRRIADAEQRYRIRLGITPSAFESSKIQK